MEAEEGDRVRLPEAVEFFLNVPLYKEFQIEESMADQLFRLEYFQGTVDAYCAGCKTHTVYQHTTTKQALEQPLRQIDTSFFVRDRVFGVNLQCSRERSHELLFIFRVKDKLIQKIGQFPSIADLHLPDLQKYRKILGTDKFLELTRGIGLASAIPGPKRKGISPTGKSGNQAVSVA